MTSLKVNSHALLIATSMFGLLVATLSSVSLAQPQAISLDAIYPPIIQRGTTQNVQVLGINIQDVDQLYFNHPGIRAELLLDGPLPFDELPQKRFGHFQLQVSGDVPTGVYEVIAIGRYGSSNPRRIVVCEESVVVLPPSSSEIIDLNNGTIYVGQTIALSKQKLRIPKSQIQESSQIQIRSATHAIDSPALLKLALKVSEQRTIASSRSIGFLPAIISFDTLDSKVLDSAQDLTLEVYDEIYRGGHPYYYLLSFSKKAEGCLKSDPAIQPVSSVVSMDLPGLPILDAVPLLTTDRALIEAASPSEIRFPSSKSFIVKVHAKDSAALECQLISHSIGQPTDYRIVVFQNYNEGKLDGQLQVIEDSPALGSKGISTGSLDPHALVNLPASAGGTVFLLVQNLQTRVDSRDQTAMLRVAPAHARFQCVAHYGAWTNAPLQSRGSGAYLQRGGTFPIHVIANRQAGFSGPISLRIEGLPEGVTAPTVVMQPTQSEIDLLVTASEEAAAWDGPLRIIANGKHGDIEMETAVPFATVWQNPSAERGPVQSRLCEELRLSLREELAPISIYPTKPDVFKVKAGEKIVVPFSVTRRVGGEAKVIMRPQNLPHKSTMAEWEIAPNAALTEREIITAADTPPGTYTLCFLAEMVWKLPLHSESLARHVAYRDRLVAKLPGFEANPEKTALEMAITNANARLEVLGKETAPRDYGTHFYTGQFTLVVE